MPPVVETRYGRVRGFSRSGVQVFRGIPYAGPPTGARRFRAPLPPEPWAGVREAIRAGDAPPQVAVPGFPSLSLAGGAAQSEDCLSLNVFTPGIDTARRPVLVFIHGGGFLIGAGSTPVYDGSGLARRGNAVVVTINYRLGVFGFLHLDGVGGERFAGASNAGLRDQISAFRWVREHAASFGGDPGNVTVWGQSAGAMSIAALLAAPSARGLFHRAILQSGAAGSVLERETANAVASSFLQSAGGLHRRPQTLEDLSVDHLLRAQGTASRELMNWNRLMSFAPAVDGDLLPEPPLDAIRSGAAADVPLLIGTTLDEWKLFGAFEGPTRSDAGLVERLARILPDAAPRAPEAARAAGFYREAVEQRGGRTTPFEVWAAFQSARVFHEPAWRLADAQAAAGGEVFSYLFRWTPPALGRALGACHAIDLPFLFGPTEGAVGMVLAGMAPRSARLARTMQDLWVRFARSGAPGPVDAIDWPAQHPGGRPTLVLSDDVRLEDSPLEPERALWEAWTDPPERALRARPVATPSGARVVPIGRRIAARSRG